MHIESAKVITVGGRRYPFTDPAQASRAYRAAIDALNLGYSNTPPCHILDGAGRKIGHVSYNGRVWSGAEWPACKLVYDPSGRYDA